MKTKLPRGLRRFVTGLVDEGLYADEGEVVRDVLRQLQRTRTSGSIDPAALVQFVMRAAFRGNMEDLRAYAEKVLHYSKARKGRKVRFILLAVEE